jgi:hypothetical protein
VTQQLGELPDLVDVEAVVVHLAEGRNTGSHVALNRQRQRSTERQVCLLGWRQLSAASNLNGNFDRFDSASPMCNLSGH